MEPPTPDADALRSTLESLLSVENLQVDSYLRGHLTSQLYVPLAVLAAILFPFLVTHAPSLAGVLIVVITLSTMIYRDSDKHQASSEAS